MKKRRYAIAQWTIVLACSFAVATAAAGQERKLTLQEAIDLATHQNHALKVASYAFAAEQQKRRMAKSSYFPTITNESNFLHITDLQRVEVPAGAFDVIPGGATIPASDLFLTQGTSTFESSGTMLAQPITQLIKIHAANKAAVADVGISQASLRKTATNVVFKVQELYYQVLTTQLQREAAELQIRPGSEFE